MFKTFFLNQRVFVEVALTKKREQKYYNGGLMDTNL